MKKRKYIEDSLFYRLFNFLHQALKINVYFTILNMALFLLCLFSSLRADTLLIFSLSFVTVGPSLLALFKIYGEGNSTEVTLMEVLRTFKAVFVKGLRYTLMLGFLVLWFVAMLVLLLHQRNLLVLFPLFLTFGVTALSTVLLTMKLVSKTETITWKSALHTSFQLSWQRLYISFIISIVIVGLIYLMYYRAVYGFLIVFSLVFSYIYNIIDRVYFTVEENK